MSIRELPSPLTEVPSTGGEYNLEKLENIVSALHFLHGEAKETGSEDMEQMIAASFNLCAATYNAILRYRMSENLSGRL